MQLQLFKTVMRPKSSKTEKKEAKIVQTNRSHKHFAKKLRLKESQQTVEENLKTLHLS